MTDNPQLLSEQQLREIAEREKKATISIAPGYYVFGNGAVFSDSGWRGHMWRELQQSPNSHGYQSVRLVTKDGKRKRCLIHKLVAEAFLPPRPTQQHEIRHLDGNKNNNDQSNLTWGTRAENAADRSKHGTCKSAENGRKSAWKLRGVSKAEFRERRERNVVR